MKVQGKTALITGASRRIGRAIALELAKQGMQRIILVARNQDRLLMVAEEIQAMGSEAITLPLDLTQTVDVNIAIANTWKKHGPIHLLVNCAGIAHQSPFLQTKLPKVQEELSLNLMGIYTMTHFLARRMASKKTETDMTRSTQRFRWVIAMTPERVAKVLVDSLEKESPEILVGWQSHLEVLGNRLVPGLLEWGLKLTTPKLDKLSVVIHK